MARLIVRFNGATREFLLSKERYTFGRTADNDVELKDPNVSRHHATLIRDQGRWTIVDQQSSNGIRVNGDPAVRRTLSDGDIVGIGTAEAMYVEETVKGTAPPAALPSPELPEVAPPLVAAPESKTSDVASGLWGEADVSILDMSPLPVRSPPAPAVGASGAKPEPDLSDVASGVWIEAQESILDINPMTGGAPAPAASTPTPESPTDPEFLRGLDPEVDATLVTNALRLGLITPQQYQECLLIQQGERVEIIRQARASRTEPDPKAGRSMLGILLAKGQLNQRQIGQLLKRQKDS